MATGFKNNKSSTKGIRFPNDLIHDIDASVEREKADNPGANFSAWVLDACERKLKGGVSPVQEEIAPARGVLTPKKMKFADCLMKGLTQREAAILAGYSEKTARIKGCRLAKDPCVIAYMENKAVTAK